MTQTDIENAPKFSVMICLFGFAYSYETYELKYIYFTILNIPLCSLQKFLERLSERKEKN